MENVIEPELVEANLTDGEMLMTGVSVALIVIVFMIGGAIASGVITGLISALSVGFMIFKTRQYKPQVWNWIVDHPLATDTLISAAFVFLIAPATATGIIAGISGALFCSSAIPYTKFLGKIEGVEPLKFPRFKKVRLGNERKQEEICAV